MNPASVDPSPLPGYHSSMASKRRRPKGGAKGRKKGSSRGSIRRRLGLWALLVLGLGLVGGTAVASVLWNRCGLAGCPDPELLLTYRAGAAPTLLDRNGDAFAELHPLEHRVVAIDSLPVWVPEAFVAVEDRRFFRHGGIDWVRVAGAALRNLRSSGGAHGASTITMQLARSVFPEQIPGEERTLRRKLVEVRVARAIEERFTKEAILELYLNHVYVGSGAHGIEAASRHAFGRPAATLDPAEAALLAGMVRAPARFDPRRHPERARARRDLVLSLMEAQGRLDPGAAEAARAAPVALAREPGAGGLVSNHPWFVEAVRQELDGVLGKAVRTPGLVVHTTLDPRAQGAAERELVRRIEAIEEGGHGPYRGPPPRPARGADERGSDLLQGAVVLLEAGSGDVLALVGGRDFGHSRYNRAIRGRRPTGSAFKPFVFAAALERGLTLGQPLADEPLRVEQAGSPPWSPRNADGEFRGMVSMRETLERSLNVPTARLGMAVGVEGVAETAERAGLARHDGPTPASVLGTASHSPLEVAAAYATLAGLGERVEPRFILRVEDAEGRALFEAMEPRRDRVMDPRVAWLVTDLLRGAVDGGTGAAARAAGFRGPAAGKTGTTQGGTDAWFAGYTPERVGVVWIGFDRPRSFLAGASGGGLAAPVWGAVMRDLERIGIPSADWPRPEGLREVSVDRETGMAVPVGCGALTERAVLEWFLEEFVPAEAACPREPGVVARIGGAIRRLFRGQVEEVIEPAPDPEADPWLGVRRVPLATG